MSNRLDVKFDPRLRQFLEEALKRKEVKNLLIRYQLKDNAQGVIKLAVIKFLDDLEIK